MSNEQIWQKIRLEQIGLVVDFHGAWPVLPTESGEEKGFYQPIDQTSGIIFIRYGQGADLEKYAAGLGDALTTVAVLKEEPLKCCGQPARRLWLRLTTPEHRVYQAEKDRGIIDKTASEAHSMISVLGFQWRGHGVLAGYRLPESMLDKYENILEQILKSISIAV